uniref:Ubiquitin-like domain-containing protein n=1 Tax=Oryzias melastigma TaxID=30732 RepID=A0A3B3DKN0_ORYME
MDTLYQVIVNRFRGKCLIINLCDAEEEMQKMTVLQLKEKMIEQYPEYRRDIETICINCYLIFGDVAMEDSEPLSEYGIQHLSVIDVMVFQSRGGDVDIRHCLSGSLCSLKIQVYVKTLCQNTCSNQFKICSKWDKPKGEEH